METDAIRSRLRRVEGQVQGVQRILEEDRSCEDVLTQMLAIRSAVEQVCLRMTQQHLRDCVFSEMEQNDPRIAEVESALKLWVRAGG